MLLEPSVRPSTLPSRPAAKQGAAEEITPRQVGIVAGFIAFHVVLGLLMRVSSIVPTLHAVATLLAGLIYTATTPRIRNVVVVLAYIAGCEVLWRMTRADVFHEFGKYATIAIALVALGRIRSPRNRTLSLLYFGLLVPSAALTVVTLPLDTARQELSFSLAGPLALAIVVILCSNLKVSANQLRTALFALIGPVVGIAAVAFASTQRAQLEFINASNSATTGGFGPNQVSALLGLAAMFLIFLSFERRMAWPYRALLLVIAAALAGQAALTFSRGGIVLAFAGTIGGLLVLLRGNVRIRLTVAVVSIICSLLGKFVVEPWLDDLTSGKISERYASTKTGRDELISTELSMFAESPVLGIGPGVGLSYRTTHGMVVSESHTEYTRMLGEHGMLGILALICLVALAARGFRQPRELFGRGLATAFIIWAALHLSVYATRVVAPAFVFGLAFCVPAVFATSTRE